MEDHSSGQTTSSSSTSSQEAGSHRNCSVCKKRISQYKFDRHTVCISCRPIVCDLNHRCGECNDWSTDEMENYLKHRKSLDSKGKKKDSKASTITQSPKQTNLVSTDMLRSLEDRLNQKFSKFFEHKLDLIDEAIGNKLTSFFSAPSKVPEPAPLGVLGGGIYRQPVKRAAGRSNSRCGASE